MDTYFEKILSLKTPVVINHTRTIKIDRVGKYSEFGVVIAWEGYTESGEFVSISPDEAKVLFDKGLLKNAYENEEGVLCLGYTYTDSACFQGSIVCGILSPDSKIRTSIIEYAKKMGYISSDNKPKRVQMYNGTKKFEVLKNGLCKIKYDFSKSVVDNFDLKMLERFTNNFWYGYNVKICSTGLTIIVSQIENFSSNFIDMLKKYDSMLMLLNPKIDRNTVLRALIFYVFSNGCHENLKLVSKYVSCNKKLHNNYYDHYCYRCSFGEGNKLVELNNSKLLYRPSFESIQHIQLETMVIFKLKVNYSEKIRKLMINFVKYFKANYKEKKDFISVDFLADSEEIIVMCTDQSKFFLGQIELDFAMLDYAISYAIDLENVYFPTFIYNIFEFLYSCRLERNSYEEIFYENYAKMLEIFDC